MVSWMFAAVVVSARAEAAFPCSYCAEQAAAMEREAADLEAEAKGFGGSREPGSMSAQFLQAAAANRSTAAQYRSDYQTCTSGRAGKVCAPGGGAAAQGAPATAGASGAASGSSSPTGLQQALGGVSDLSGAVSQRSAQQANVALDNLSHAASEIAISDQAANAARDVASMIGGSSSLALPAPSPARSPTPPRPEPAVGAAEVDGGFGGSPHPTGAVGRLSNAPSAQGPLSVDIWQDALRLADTPADVPRVDALQLLDGPGVAGAGMLWDAIAPAPLVPGASTSDLPTGWQGALADQGPPAGGTQDWQALAMGLVPPPSTGGLVGTSVVQDGSVALGGRSGDASRDTLAAVLASDDPAAASAWVDGLGGNPLVVYEALSGPQGPWAALLLDPQGTLPDWSRQLDAIARAWAPTGHHPPGRFGVAFDWLSSEVGR